VISLRLICLILQTFVLLADLKCRLPRGLIPISFTMRTVLNPIHRLLTFAVCLEDGWRLSWRTSGLSPGSLLRWILREIYFWAVPPKDLCFMSDWLGVWSAPSTLLKHSNSATKRVFQFPHIISSNQILFLTRLSKLKMSSIPSPGLAIANPLWVPEL
jgi:hypothetical protein